MKDSAAAALRIARAEGGSAETSFREIKHGKTTGVYQEHPDHFEVASIRTPQAHRGQGGADAVMRALNAAADAAKKPSRLLASPLDKKTQLRKLVKFYQKHGYEVTGERGNAAGEPWMQRDPKQSGGRVARAGGGLVREPSFAQKEAGNYKKGHLSFHGLNIAIENPKGSKRRGIAANGHKWSCTMPADYGYIKRTEGADGDHVDCYVGPHKDSHIVFVVNQRNPGGGFDEHKCLLGFRDEAEAAKVYDAGFSDGSGPRRRAGMQTLSLKAFKDWLKTGETTKPIRVARAAGGQVSVAGRDGFLRDVDRGYLKGDARPINRAMTHLRENDKYTVADVPFDRLIGTQPYINADYRENAKRYSGEHKDLPSVYRIAKKNYVTDGHHRLAAQRADGQKAARVRFYDVDEHLAGAPVDRSTPLLDAVARKARAAGGQVTKTFSGPLHSHVPGRTDHLPMRVDSGSYVLPADVVSSFGEGNTMAAFKVLRRLFGGLPYENNETPYGGKDGPYNEKLPGKAEGGATTAVPVVVAGGEYVLSPKQVAMLGDGDMDMGHRVLDQFVLHSRKKLIKTLQGLPGPKRN